MARDSGSRVGRGRPSPPGEDSYHHEGSDRQDDDPHAVRDGSPGRTTGADPREHEPKNQAYAQAASASVFADALTLPALEAGQSHSPRRVVTTRDGVAQLKRDALRLASNSHGRDVSSVLCTGSPTGSELTSAASAFRRLRHSAPKELA